MACPRRPSPSANASVWPSACEPTDREDVEAASIVEDDYAARTPHGALSTNHPAHRVTRQIRRHPMTAVEFLERHVVSLCAQLRHDHAAALIDRQDRIRSAVRDEEARA